MKKYYFHNDPGHGWVAVKRKELSDLGILHQISNYSYQRGKTVYLEEDCDALLWYNAYMKAHGRQPEYINSYTNTSSPIRGYEQFDDGLGPFPEGL